MKKKFDELLNKIFTDIKSKFNTIGKFDAVLVNKESYTANDLRFNQEPEPFVKDNIIEPIFSFLGLEKTPQTQIKTPEGMRKPDYVYVATNSGLTFLVEAEPLNVDLYAKGGGNSQVDGWLLSKLSKTEYGIATNGFEWNILKFNPTSVHADVIRSFDLRLVFQKIYNPRILTSEEEINTIKEDFLSLDKSTILSMLNGCLIKMEGEKEKISNTFYKDYVRFVFGYDEKGEKITGGQSLINAIIAPYGAKEQDKNLFAVVLMNRLIFIRFLEEKGIVPRELLKRLIEKYTTNPSAARFYTAFLTPLFYNVFSKSPPRDLQGDPYDKIPYLNGGLFRAILKNELSYDVTNDGLKLVTEKILNAYKFDLASTIGKTVDPSILGYIFEKTINYISRPGTNKQKLEGAYYTPDDVVKFIVEKTLSPIIFEKMIEGLRRSGWKDKDLLGFDSIEAIQQNTPNPLHVKEMIGCINTIRILDPACGSGHFLTAALAEILRVKESLLRGANQEVDRYKLKKEIVSKNIFGVDLDENAVEIARLRLWLSLIEDVETGEHIDTLPNIDFNIIAGNSLLGATNENISVHPLITLLDYEECVKHLNELRKSHPTQIDEVLQLLQTPSPKISDTLSAYHKLLPLYKLESGEKAAEIRDVVGKIRDSLYDVMNGAYTNYLKDHGQLSKDVITEIHKNIAGRRPFHWNVDFADALNAGGFDAVLGNPPYIEDGNYDSTDIGVINISMKRLKGSNKRKSKIESKPLLYSSRKSGNTYAYFIERSLNLTKQNGRFGFIVEVSLVSTDRMEDIREYTHSNSSEVAYYNFDDRPGKIFSGLEHCRSTIIITKKGRGVEAVTTSKYHRWRTKDRSNLFNTLQTTNWALGNKKEIVPKMGSNIEKSVLTKMFSKANGKTIKDFVANEGIKVWYHNAPQYWIHAHDDGHLPKVEYYNEYEKNPQTKKIKLKKLETAEPSDQYKFVELKNPSDKIEIGLLGSSLFYWWFILWSDGRHLLDQQIKTFPIDFENFPPELNEKLQILANKLMNEYDQNANEKVNERKGGYAIKIKEIIPRKSKKTIDEIDDIFANYFGFTQDEMEFIKKFDIKFRMDLEEETQSKITE